MISIIIPAHNEEAVIGRCLSAITEGAVPGELEVIVVANGCTDGTARAARAFGGGVKVIETPVASKTSALNLGDATATGYPRFYVDGDVVLPLESIRRIARHLEESGSPAAAPEARLELSGCSRWVKAFYRVDQRLPSQQEGIGGSGVYALSEAGRARFGAFPDVVADDGFVRRQFAPAERVRVKGAWSIVHAPRTLWGVVKIKTRSHLGNYELAERFPELTKNRGAENRGALLGLLKQVGLWPSLFVYVLVKTIARLRAVQRHRSNARAWERDETSRQGSGTRRRVVAIASGGGHWIQLMRMVPALGDCEVSFITTLPGYRTQVGASRYYVVGDANRWNKLGLLRTALSIAWILWRERPDVVMSTGAAPGYLGVRMGKLLGAKTIWVDSVANVEELSMSGRKIGSHADLWLTQWPHLATPQGPFFAGAVL